MDGKVIALGDSIDNTLKVAEIETRGYALGIQVQSKVDEIDIACSFAVAEQATFNSVATGQNTKFGRSNASPCNGRLGAITRNNVNTCLDHYGDVG